MEVQVKLFAIFREGRFENEQVQVPDGSCLNDLFDVLGITSEEVGILLLNGSAVSSEHKLAQGDLVSIFPAIGGG